MLKHLLVHVDSGDRGGERLRLAVGLATAFDARLTGLFAETAFLGRSVVTRRSPQNLAKAADRAREAFEAAAAPAHLRTEWWQVRPEEYGDVIGWTIVCCRHSDLAILGQHEPGYPSGVPEDLVEQVVAKSGRPVLVVPWFGQHAGFGRRILVVWSGSREAARALADALPLLRRAERVRVLALQQRQERTAVPGPPVDVMAHLRDHGIEAEHERVLVEDIGAVANVLNGAAEFMADLVVMGDHEASGPAFARGRATTRDLLAAMTTPVLLSR